MDLSRLVPSILLASALQSWFRGSGEDRQVSKEIPKTVDLNGEFCSFTHTGDVI
jgi:hypothetical protein